MILLAYATICIAGGLSIYAFLLYPALLSLLKRRNSFAIPRHSSNAPSVSIVIPCFNEERSIGATLERLLAVPCPGPRQVLVVSDASTDRTEAIVGEYADAGVELLRIPTRGGKTAAENFAAGRLHGDIIVHMDATVSLSTTSLASLVQAFNDPTVGVASGRDVSVEAKGSRLSSQGGEATYVGYEMWLRDLESRVGSIIGASGCLYAVRRSLMDYDAPAAVTRDFLSALVACERGYRSVAVSAATCYVPRAANSGVEFQRKTRTMAGGLETLWLKRELLNPFRHGMFAWMLISHKLVRWLLFLVIPAGVAAIAMLATHDTYAQVVLGAIAFGVAIGVTGWRWGNRPGIPKVVGIAGFVLIACVAGVVAWAKVFRRRTETSWEPTRRVAIPARERFHTGFTPAKECGFSERVT